MPTHNIQTYKIHQTKHKPVFADTIYNVCSRVEEALIEMYLAGIPARRAWVAGYQKITHAAHHIAGNPTSISRWIKSLPLYTVHNNEQKFFS